MDDRGFVWDYMEDRWENGIKAGLLEYYQKHGNLKVRRERREGGGGPRMPCMMLCVRSSLYT